MSVDGLLSSVTTQPAGKLIDDATTNTEVTSTCTNAVDACTGSGAEFTVRGNGNSGVAGLKATGGIICTKAGSGYKAGDVLTLAYAAGTTAGSFVTTNTAAGDIVITLSADDISVGGLGGTLDLLLGSVTTQPNGKLIDDDTTNTEVTSTCANAVDACTGSGAEFTVRGNGNSGAAGLKATGGIICTKAGSGYKAGDVLTLAYAADTTAGKFETTDDVSGDIVITLSASDINGYVKRTPSDGFYLNSDGELFGVANDGNFIKTALTGYYLALGKATNFIALKIGIDSGTVVPSINGVSGTSLADDVLSTLIPVQGGMNMLKIVSSVDGTFEMNLIKPDNEIKVIQRSKRSMEIAYNPAEVGEFTCSAFTDTAGPPTSRANVETLSGVIAKSVRTHNILPENRFNSIQMTLNGLTPSTIYDVHCFHLSHGIISNTAATTVTDLASLTGVSLEPDVTAKGAIGTLTLKFTHEISLASGFTVKLRLYTDYSAVQAIATTGDCGDQITTVTSQPSSSGSVASPISGTHACAEVSSTDVLQITVNGVSEVSSGSSGNEVVILLTNHASKLVIPNNLPEGTKVTMDLEVANHGKLRQQVAWTTTA
jgi:hypothetical protein